MAIWKNNYITGYHGINKKTIEQIYSKYKNIKYEYQLPYIRTLVGNSMGRTKFRLEYVGKQLIYKVVTFSNSKKVKPKTVYCTLDQPLLTLRGPMTVGELCDNPQTDLVYVHYYTWENTWAPERKSLSDIRKDKLDDCYKIVNLRGQTDRFIMGSGIVLG